MSQIEDKIPTADVMRERAESLSSARHKAALEAVVSAITKADPAAGGVRVPWPQRHKAVEDALARKGYEVRFNPGRCHHPADPDEPMLEIRWAR